MKTELKTTTQSRISDLDAFEDRADRAGYRWDFVAAITRIVLWMRLSIPMSKDMGVRAVAMDASREERERAVKTAGVREELKRIGDRVWEEGEEEELAKTTRAVKALKI